MSLKKKTKISENDSRKLERLVRSVKILVEHETDEKYSGTKMDPVMNDFEQKVREIFQAQELERQKKEVAKKLKKSQKKSRWR